MTDDPTRPILIAGPTASGKSALALAVAERVRGVIINADSMQVYRELRVLTARPGPEEEASVPHLLYGHVPAGEPYSVARWLEDVRGALAAARDMGRRPIIVGGTGLYFKGLTEGLAPVPEIPPAVRVYWREAAQTLPAQELHKLLRERDPAMAARLAPADRQRVTRALEVIDATGRSLAEWHLATGTPLVAKDGFVGLVMDRPRDELQTRADQRFDRMMSDGAVEEVRALMALGLEPDLPAMRALGVPDLAAMLRGEIGREAAVSGAKLETRKYIKRQQTWLKRHMIAWKSVDETFSLDLS
jgi:tRNA dimethylallyltransferase